MQVQNLKLVGSWPELSGSVVHLRGIGHTKSFSRHLLILQPVGCLVPYNIGLESLLSIMKQFACVVKQLSAKGYLHGDLSYYNLLKHPERDAALLVDMQTLMPLQQVHILDWNSGLTMLQELQPFVLCLMSMLWLCRLLVRGSQVARPCLWGGMSFASGAIVSVLSWNP